MLRIPPAQPPSSKQHRKDMLAPRVTSLTAGAFHKSDFEAGTENLRHCSIKDTAHHPSHWLGAGGSREENYTLVKHTKVK